MKVFLLLALSVCALAQDTQHIDVSQALADRMAPPSTSPERVVAVVDGVKITAGELFRFYSNLSSTVQFYLAQNRKELVERYVTTRKILQEAIDTKLDQKEPYKSRLTNSRESILMQAQMEEVANRKTLTEQERQKYYNDHIDNYTFALVRGIQVANNDAEAQKKAAAIVKRIRDGEDFAKVAIETSADRRTGEQGGQLGQVSKNGPQPEETRKAIFALKPGQVSDPLDFRGSLWIFGMDKLLVKSYEEVKDEVFQSMKQDIVEQHLQGIRKRLDIQVKDEDYFQKVAVPESVELGTGAAASTKPKQ